MNHKRRKRRKRMTSRKKKDSEMDKYGKRIPYETIHDLSAKDALCGYIRELRHDGTTYSGICLLKEKSGLGRLCQDTDIPHRETCPVYINWRRRNENIKLILWDRRK